MCNCGAVQTHRVIVTLADGSQVERNITGMCASRAGLEAAMWAQEKTGQMIKHIATVSDRPASEYRESALGEVE